MAGSWAKTTLSVKWKHVLSLGERAQIQLLRSQVHQCATLQGWRPLSAGNQVRGHCHSVGTPPEGYYPSSHCQEGSKLTEDSLSMKESATAATTHGPCWGWGGEQTASASTSCPLRCCAECRLTGPVLSATSKHTAGLQRDSVLVSVLPVSRQEGRHNSRPCPPDTGQGTGPGEPLYSPLEWPFLKLLQKNVQTPKLGF